MGRLFALADLHLSLTGLKPMDRFGEMWQDHAQTMAEAWDAAVDADDTVLLAGDLSWGRNAAEAEPDLAWIGARPGHKLLLRGNHDSWWGSASKVRALLPAGCEALQNDAHRVGPWVVLGARGWTAPGDPMARPGDEKIFRRELERLRISIRTADRQFGRELPRLALLHYPPWLDPEHPTSVVGLLRAASVRACVYGHLHGEDHRRAVTGERDGIAYHFVAADAVAFAPVEIPPRTEIMDPTTAPTLSERLYACGPAARWLPRILAAAILIGAMLVAYRFAPHRSLSFARSLQGILVVLGAAIGLWIVRSGAELRLRVGIVREGLRFDYGKGPVTLAFDDVQRLDFEDPLSSSRRLWPATVLLDDRGRAWRLPALLRQGDRLIRVLVATSGREDLEAWAESLHLSRRMGRATALVAGGYVLAGAVVAAAFAFYAH